MPITEHTKQTIEQDETEGQRSLATAFRKPAPKAAGTRMSIMEDWRQGVTSGKARRPHGQAIRDGR